MMDSYERTSSGNTILVLDIDQLVSRAVLCDVVEGYARLINVAEVPTTAGSPFFDLSVGLNRALKRLEVDAGRTLLEGERVITPSTPEGDGVDQVLITGLPAPAIRVGMVAINSDDLASELRGAVRQTVSHLYDAADYVQWTESSFTPSVLEGWLRDSRPTTLLLISKDGPLEEWRASLDIIAGVAPQFGATQGIIIADGPRQNVAAEVLDDVLELSGIDPASYSPEEIASAVEAELRDQYAGLLQSEPAFRPFAEATFVDRLQAIDNVAAFLHRRMGRNLAMVFGQQGTLLNVASEQRGYLVYRADLDLGYQAHSILQLAPSLIGRWLPFQITDDEMHHWLLNRSLRPLTILEGDNDQAIASAVTLELLSTLRESAGLSAADNLDFIVLGREWSDAIGDSAPLAFLDGLNPVPAQGMIVLSIDRDNVAASLGAIAAVAPDYAREVVESDFLAPLASCIIMSGTGEYGDPVARVEIVFDDGQQHELEMSLGEIQRVDIPEGRTAEVTVFPENDYAVGRQRHGEPAYFVGDNAVLGGEFGVVIDARGRPVDLPIEPEARVASLSQWARALGAEQAQSERVR